MVEQKQNPVIRNSLFLLLGVFLIILLLNYILTSYFFNAIEQGQYLVNIAGKNRTLSQLILVDAQKVSEGNENMKIILREHITEHARILRALRDGGTITVDRQEVSIQDRADKSILPSIRRVEQFWKPYQDSANVVVSEPIKITIRVEKDEKKVNIETDILDLEKFSNDEIQITNPRVLSAIAYLRSKSNEMLLLNEQLVREYLDFLDKKRQNADLIILILTLINIGAIIVAFFVIKDVVLRPLNLIAYAAEEIAEGVSSKPINYEFNNEVGSVVKAINKMVDSLESATNFIQDIGNGNLQAQYKGINTQTDLEKETLAGALLDMRDRMINVAQSERNREWSNTGLTKFVEILRQNNDDLRRLSYSVLVELIHYVGAAQGGLYIINDDVQDDQHAELVAAYAFEKQKFINQKIYPHEGVIGQLLIDGDTIYLNDVPDNYADITSGLGGARPNSVLLVPLKLNEKLIGLVELTSFQSFESYKIEFIERLANNIASTISNVKVNERTRLLLEEQQRITLQMRLQEDDMKTNMLQLQSTQEEMRKNEEALKSQSFAIASTLVEAEYDMEGRLVNANGQFLAKLKYKLSEIKGKNHRILLDTQSSYSEEYLKFWDNLRAGKTQIGEYKRVAKDGSEIWLRATYVPIPNRNDELYKVTCLAFDVTEEKQRVIDYQGQVEALRRSSLVIEFDLQGFIIDANNAILNLFKYDKEDLINKHYNTLMLLEEFEDDNYKVRWRQLKGGKYESGEYEYKAQDNEKIWLSGSFNPIFDLNGNTTKILMLADDITKRKETERQIQEVQQKTKVQQENLTALINNTDERILSIDKHYYVTIINENVRKVFQQMGREVEIGSNILDTFPDRTYNKLKDPYDRALNGEKVRVEETYVGAKGEDIQLLVTYNPIFDDSDNVQGVTVFAKDITEIKKTQEELIRIQQEMEEKEADLRALINNLEDCVFAIDNKLNFVVFNDSYASLLKEKKNYELQIGESITKIYTTSEWESWKLIFDKALAGERFKQNVTLFDDLYELAANTILDKKGKIIGAALDMRKIEL
ncbi:MAG: PAS domain S-box protein [Raineya sp.]|jgi:PAS domain S-box-containing protein|nr:PAS domain S-box protein [Raineya sp.]